MRVLVAGGTGLIGSALVSSFLGSKWEVTVLSRSPQRRQPEIHKGAKLEKWDGQSPEGWGHLVSQVDAIVNLAGEGIADGRWTQDRKTRILESRVNAGRALVSALQSAENLPRVLIQSSAVGYYGPCADQELTEESPSGNDFLAQVCVDWEASTEPVEALGVRRAVVRTGVVLSARGGALPRMALPFRLFAGGPLGGGNQYFPWIHIEDEVSAIRFLLENDSAAGPYNLAAPDPPRNRDFVRDLGRVMGRPSLMPTPSFALQALFGEMSTVLLDGQRAIPARLQEASFDFGFPHAVAALQDLV